MQLQVHGTEPEESEIRDFNDFTSLGLKLTDYRGHEITINLFFKTREGPIAIVNAITSAINRRQNA